MRRITKSQATSFATRWANVGVADAAELRATSMTRKLRQLIALMSSVQPLGWTKALAAEEAGVRRRWMRLRKIARG
jgi:hypothetical protein